MPQFANRSLANPPVQTDDDLHALARWERLVNLREYFPVRMKWKDGLFQRMQV